MIHLGTDADMSAQREQSARVERERRFLLRELPGDLTRADPHLQLFDNYITNTRLRLRKVRLPQTREWIWKLTQKFAPDPADPARTLVTDIYLARGEYETLAVFEANEIRKNRYPYEHAGRAYTIDVFLGALHGLILAETTFTSDDEKRGFQTPPFVAFDVSDDEMFNGGNLVNLTTDEIRATLKATMKD